MILQWQILLSWGCDLGIWPVVSLKAQQLVSQIVNGDESRITMRRENFGVWNWVAAVQNGLKHPSPMLGTALVPELGTIPLVMLVYTARNRELLFSSLSRTDQFIFSLTQSFPRCISTVYPLWFRLPVEVSPCSEHPPATPRIDFMVWFSEGSPISLNSKVWVNASLQLMDTDKTLSKDFEAKVFWAKESITGCGSQVRKHFQKAAKTVCSVQHACISDLESFRGSILTLITWSLFTCTFVYIKCAN